MLLLAVPHTWRGKEIGFFMLLHKKFIDLHTKKFFFPKALKRWYLIWLQLINVPDKENLNYRVFCLKTKTRDSSSEMVHIWQHVCIEMSNHDFFKFFPILVKKLRFLIDNRKLWQIRPLSAHAIKSIKVLISWEFWGLLPMK